MEIKGINGIVSAYKTNKTSAPKKPSASAAVKSNTDRVEFGFEAAIANAKAAIAAEVKADAAPKELVEASETAEKGVDAAALASYILLG